MANINALSGLLNILVGSGREAGIAKGTKASTTAGVSAAKLKNIVSKIQTDIRGAIESNLPVFYLVNAEVIVDSMLQELHPSNGNALSKYLVDMRTSTGDIYTFDSIVGNVTQVRNAFGKVISESNEGGFLEEYTEKYNILVSHRDSLVRNVTLGLRKSVNNRVTILSISNILAGLNASLAKKLALLSAYPEELDSKAQIEATKHLRAVGALLRRKFKSIGTSVVTDADFFLTNYDPAIQVLTVGVNYTTLTSTVHGAVTPILERYLKGLNIKVFTGTTGFKAGNFAAAGHSALRSGSNIIGINTPLSQIVGMILSNNSLDAPGIMNGFVVNTGHSDYAIDVTENYKSAGNLALSIGISFLQSQPSVYNSTVLGPEEKQNFEKFFKEQLSKDYSKLRKSLNTALKDSKVFSYLFKTFRMSPTMKEALEGHLKAALTGSSYTGPAGSGKALLPTGKDQIISLSGKASKTKVSAPSSIITAPSKAPILKKDPQLDLVSLTSFINTHLQDVISANMGDGSRRDVLNYRTGRFAASVKVERMSKSREGMITAFYSYMKNPYATFSDGGEQQFPKSRDPKTLISKSIREIAAEKVANRLRAVVV